MNRIAWAIACACTWMSSTVWAQSLPDRWSESAAIARAVAHAPRVRAATAALESAQAMNAFGRMPVVGNPTLGVRALFGVRNPEASTISVFVGLPFDVSGRASQWRRETVWAIRHAEDALAVHANDARAAAREAYADVAIADLLVRSAEARVENYREVLARQRARLAAQAATALDVTLSERDLAEAEADLAVARRERDEAAARFREALDLPPDRIVAVEPLSAPAMPDGLTREVAVERALARRHEAPALLAAASRFRASTDRLRAEAVAPLLVSAEVEVQQYQFPAVGGSLQWALPVSLTNQAERSFAMAQANGLESQRTVAARTVAREAGGAFDALARRLEELRALTDGALPAAARALELTDALYGAGAADYFRVLLARRDLFATRVRQIQVTRDAWRARIALDRAMGDVSR